MARLPLLISVPHAGLRIPPEVAALNRLTAREIAHDGDEGAWEIYAPLKDHVAAFATSDIARAFVDLNRAEDDIRKDGVVKTHTCWDVPIYCHPLSAELIETLLARYHRPYHKRLTDLADSGVIAGVDCHTMAAIAPPEAPDPGCPRPAVCIGDANGACPHDWAMALADCFRETFDGEVTLNRPFSGGFITRHHAKEIPWIQIELSRGGSASFEIKGAQVLQSLSAWIARISRQS
ncbi:N-formylglutamate amidohydrolase [Imhoffiella purpurea]|uniref:N-formylglutamate deformylase n=1 Tax=Imhoffiella purpurea TaxID=1249627 RepID=W9VFC7_9GAMM|nr:N-formylglutamate amidohydrolase [Imhoffiella purpurea]EXJ14752.1 N-formylglutamate deformylase [Imhoffiella purpurea]